MFKLFSLISFLILPLFTQNSLAAEGNFGVDYITSTQTGTVDVFRLDNQDTASSKLVRFKLTLPTLKKYWTVGFNLDVAKRDYSTFLIRDEDGNENSLSETFDSKEYSATTAVSFQKDKDSLSFVAAKSLGESPFSFTGGSVAYDRLFLNKKRILGVKLIGASKMQPASFYIDPKDQKTKSRPTNLKSFRYETHWNEAFTQNWRMNTILFYGTRRVDRPDHFGGEIRNGIGIGDQFTARLHTGILTERKTDLKDDRGRFNIIWIESSIFYELTYDLSIEASYGVTYEKEHLIDGRKPKIGSDTYGLKMKYEGKNKTFTASYLYRKTNTNYTSHTIQGGIQWSI